MSEADSILAGINNSRQNAQTTAVGAIDADPDQAGRAIELEKATGVSSAAIYGDVEGFEAQHKAALAGEIVKNNPHIANYINSHPLAAAVSNGDLGQLDTISQSISNLTGEERANLFRGRIHDILPTAQQTPEPNRPSPAELMKQWEGKPALNSITGSRDIGDYLNHYINNVVSTLGEETEESAKQVVDPDRPVSERAIAASVAVPKAIAYTGLAMMQPINDAFQAIGDTIERLSGGHIWSQDVQTALMMPGILGLGGRVGDLKFGKALKDHVEAINLAAPHILEGKLPPVGLNDLLDGAHKELAKQDIKNLGDLEKEVQKSQTKEIAPELFEKNFLTPRTDDTMGIDAAAVKKLYGDKIPEPDDNILGFIPNLAEQIAGAEQFGGRIEIPLASWLAKVDPEVAKVLKDDIAVRRGGMTINETKPPEIAEGAEKPQPKPAPIDSIDAIRRPAGLDPMAALGQIQLRKIETNVLGHTFDFEDAEGKRVGGATVREIADDTLRITSITGGTAEGLPGIFGIRQVTGLLRQLQQEFPNAKRVEGLRISGAREEAGMASISLRPSEKQLTDFMRSGFEAQTVMDSGGKIHDVQPVYSTTVGESIPAESVAKATDSPVMQFFGKKIHELTKDVPIHVITQADMTRLYGDTVPGFHQLFLDGSSNIFLSDDIGFQNPQDVLHLVMHEASHAATVMAIEDNYEIKSKIRSLMNEVDAHLHTLHYWERKKHDYAFTNEKEFVAEGQSKESFQEALKLVPVTRKLAKALGGEPANAWEALKNIVREIWERITGKEVPQNALDALFKLSEEIEIAQKEVIGRGKVGTDFAPPKETQLELPGLTRIEDREAFEKAAAIGMTVKQFRQYQELIEKRDVQDMDHFRAQAERRERQRQTAEWKTEENRAREEAKTNLQGRPDIAADNLLRDGTYLGEKLKGRVRLDSDKLSAEQKAGLPEDYLKSGGINPDDAATMFGYHNPDAMLGAIKQLHADRGELGPKEHINKLAEKITQDHMTREFGNLEQNILEEAKDHVISPTQLDILHEELVALGTKNEGQLPISKADLKAWVKRQFSEMPISMHSVDTYLAAAGRSGRGAELALLDDDPRTAFKFKEQQYVSMLMANEAKAYEKLRKATDKIADRVARPKYNGMNNNYLAHLRDQLGNAGLRTGKSIQGLADDIKAAGNLTAFAQRESNMKAIQFLFPDWVYAGEKIPIDKMTYEQFRGFSDTVKQLYTLGREDKVFTTRSGKYSLRQTIDNEAILQLAKQGETGTPYNVEGIDKLTQGTKEIVYGFLIQPFSVFNRWDLGDKHGFYNMNFVYTGMSAASEYSARIKSYASKLDEAFKGIADVNLKGSLPSLLKRVSRDEMVNMTMENLQRIIMDMGNPNNMDKFIRGWKVDKDVLWSYLKAHSTKEMWDTWQKVGDINKEAFTELREMIRDQNGVVPDLVELEPFIDPHGVQRAGWYSPMIYDQKELGSSRAADGLHAVNPADMGGLFDTGYFKASTATGSEIRRTSYAAPTDLTLNRLPQRMTQILYDTSFRPFVINFGKMLRDTEFRHAIERHSGEPVLHMMDDWLRDIVGGNKGISTVADQTLGRVSEYFRRNMIGSFIGWNVHTAEKHGITAAVNSLAEVGPVNFAREVKTLFATSPDGFKSNFNFAIDKSLELQRRFQTIRETLGGQFEGLKFKDKGFWAARDWMLEKGGFLVGWSDMMSSVPSWLAEYKKQMNELGQKFPDKLPEEYDGTAIEIANSIVLRAHGSTAITARPGAMRGSSTGRLFTSLYSVFNQMLQRQFEAYWRTKYAKDNYKELEYSEIRGHLGKAALLIATSALWPVLTEHMVTPDPERDKKGWLAKTGEYLAEGATLGIPIAREVVHGFLTSGEGGAGMLDSELKTVASSFADVEKGAKAMDKEHGGKTIKDFTSLIGLATGLPGEAGNILETIWNAMHHSKQAPRNPAETYRALTTGKAIGQPDLIQRGIEATGKGRRK